MSDSESDSEGEKIRRTKRKVVVKFEFDDSESTQSDSDVSIPMQPARTSRRRRKLLSSEEDDEEEEMQSESMNNVRTRRSGPGTNAQNSQTTFYDDGDESSDSSWCPETAGPSSRPNARNMPKKVATQCATEPDKDEQSETSSDDAGVEKCPICLHSFREQEIGMPNICEHSFCAPCIEEWSKNVQTCPIDRKEFTYINVRDRYENGKLVREIKVVAQSTTLSLDDDDSDVTLCEICSHGDREDRMLLCDDCNLGYHMDCLNPPLTDVPTGSWYCDNCFASEQSSGEDDIHQLIEELETEIGIPETRLRVRRVGDQPRITRTRQSERIRASILSRIAPSRRHASTNQGESALGMILPGPSRITTTTTTTTTTSTSSRTTRLLTGRRKKRRKRKRRTYVVEYDVNNYDEKFSIKTTKRVVKRRRRKTTTKPKIRTTKRRRVTGGRCRRSSNRSATAVAGAANSTKSAGIQKPIDGAYPKLHLFGNKNALEYFSDDDDDESVNEFEERSGHGFSGSGGSSLLATALTRTRIGGNSSLRRRKRIVSALDANPATADSIDILSNIMETMDRLNPVIRPNESIKKDDDLKKSLEKKDTQKPDTEDRKNSDVLHAPMYPGGGSGSSSGYNNNNRFQNNDQSFRNTSRNSGGTSNNNTSNNSSSSGSSTSTSMSFSIFGPRPTFPSAGGNNNNNCGNTGGPATNNFPSRFPSTPPNRTQRPQFRPRTPFNQTPSPQRFSPRNFNNRFLRPSNDSPNIEVARQGGLYDDVEMPTNSQDIRVPTSQQPQTPSLLDMRIPNPNANIPDLRTPPQHAPQRDFQLNHRMSAPPPHLSSPMNMQQQQQHHINPMTRPPMQQQTFINSMHELPPPQSPQMQQHLPSMTSMCMQTPPPPIPPMMLHTPTHIMPPPIIPQMPFNNPQMFLPDVQNQIQVLGCMPPPKNFQNVNQSFGNNKNFNQNDSSVESEENVRHSNLRPIDAELDIPLPANECQATSHNSTLRGLAEYSGSDDEDDCPNLLVYSAESLNMIKQPDSMDEPLVFGPINRPCNEHEMERDEDLVQMDDDDDDDNDEEDEVEQQEDNQANENAPAAEGRSSRNEDESKATSSGKKNVLELYDDSDWEEYNVKNDEDKTKADSDDKNDGSPANTNEEQADERSYTPCLDEQFQLSGEGDKIKESNDDLDDGDNSSVVCDDDKDKNDDGQSQRPNSVSGIGGMETELISDDDDEDILSKGQNGADEGTKGGSNRSGKKTADKKRDTKSNEDGNKDKRKKKDESFKKISRSNKDRNYRDKKFDSKRRGRRNRSRSRSRSRTRSRSRSNNKENRRFKRDKFRRRDNKRKDIERYDVRHVIAERLPRTFKDKYGRDTSRPPRSRSPSLPRSRKRTKSPSRTRQSRSILSVSPRRRSPSRRRSLSRVRSISRGRRHSLSRPVRRISHTPPPALRRRSRTPIRSRSRSRALNGRQIRSNSLSPRQFNRPVSRQPSPSPVRSKVRSKNRRKDGEKKAVKRKMKKRLKCPEPAKKAATITTMAAPRSRSKSWENIDRLSPWTRSPTPLRIDEPNNDHSWTPPIATETENLTVILKNKDAKRKKEKKKRTEKKRELQQKRERRKLRNDKPAPSKEVFASGDNILVSVSFNKEANKAQQTTIVTLPPTKEQILPKKAAEREPVPKRSKRGPRKHKKITAKPVAIIDLDRSPFKEITPSPKAVIVLSDSDHEDNNTTDKQDRPTIPVSDNEVSSSNMNNRCMDTQNEQISQPQSPTMDDLSFENTTLGPKTPPEPSSIVKFSLPLKMKNKLRVVNNPLHEIHEDDDGDDKQNEDSTLNVGDSSQQQQQQQKVGPNTPPESGPPESPDAYDPFEPTKSPSQSPENRSDNCDSSPNDRDDSHTIKSDISTNQDDKLQQQQQQQQQEKTVKPVDLTIALINSKASMDAAHSLLSSTLEGGVNESEINDDDVQILSPNDDSDDIPKPQTINVISNVILSHPKESMRQQRTVGLALPSFSSSAISPAKTNQSSSTPKQSPMKPKFTSGSLISKLPLPKPSKSLAVNRHNGGNDENMDMDGSPYSPDSSDYDDLFEPPNASPPAQSSSQQQRKNKSGKASGGKTEIFEDLFGSTSPIAKSSGRNKKQRSKKSSIKEWLSENKKSSSAFAKMTDDQIRILDDLPSSAVDLQVKDKFLRKIHRQERVVEEVKLVLKPHYNKKHISKDDYKEILRRAVPKICHNRTGEINPKKIHALIEAYVKKFRHRRKLTSTTNVK